MSGITSLPEVQYALINQSPAHMKLSSFAIRYSILLFSAASLSACSDLEKLFSGSNKSGAHSPDAVQLSAPKPSKLDFKMSPACLFPQVTVPNNIEVFAIDGQAWIDQAAKLESVDSDSPVITIHVDTPDPAALLLTADKTARWRIITTPRTKLWGVYVSAFEPQRVSGIITPTKFQEHYRSLGDDCGIYWAPEFQIHQLYEFSRQVFGKPYVALPKIVNGSVEVKSLGPIVTVPEKVVAKKLPEAAIYYEPIPPAKKPIAVKPAAPPMTLDQALRVGVIRPGTQSDIERFKSKYRATNQTERGNQFIDQLTARSLYVITSDYTFPGDGSYAGAHSVVLILEDGAPYPSGSSEHSMVLDMKSGACLGRICGF